ncbi:MAG: tetratricopeptide repeat protein [Phycisphaerae bacterium]|nr:tetratricopeptide repeat protein [Phycisphaerae bacterium]
MRPTAPINHHFFLDLRLRVAWVSLLAVTWTPIALFLTAGCAQERSVAAASSQGESTERRAEAPLHKTSARQQRSPDQRALRAPIPPGLPAELGEPFANDELERAKMSLTSTLAAIRAAAPSAPSPPPSAPARELTEADRLDAARGYVIGRAQHLAGDHALAEASLKQAARIDPDSPEIWRELAETQADLGNRSAAMSAFKRTLSLAPDDIPSLDALSRAALERGEWTEAALLLDRLRALPIEGHDPALPYLVSARLGRALAGLGYTTASFEAMSEALHLPDSFGETTQFQSELGLLYRQRGDLWRDAGDGMLRLNEFVKAGSCYEEAARFALLNPAALTPRRVFAQMRQGRSADAALILVGLMRQQDGRADEQLLSLLRYVSTNSSVGTAAAETVDSVQIELSEADRAIGASSIVRAKAACLGDAEAVRLLAQQLRAFPADGATLRDLFSRLDRSRPDVFLNEILSLIAGAPLQESRYARAALAGESDPSRLRAALDALKPDRAAKPEARLFRARLLEAAGDHAAAEQELASLLQSFPDYPAAIIARTSLLWRLGRGDEAQALISTIGDTAEPALREAKILALTEIGDHESASALITPMLPALDRAQSTDVDRLLLAARLRLLNGEFSEAERLLRTVNLVDPTRDEAYGVLLNLYSRSGPLASESKLVATIRSLRENSPSSPTLRLLRAQEALQRDQLDIAERDLLDLSEESPARPGVVEALVRLWSNLGRHAHAEEWLREQAERRPDESIFTVQLALLLDGRGRRPEAIGVLESRLARMPGDDAASRTLEGWLREDPSQRERAEALARARIARSPKTVDAMIELAEVSASSGRYEEAADAVRRAASAHRSLRPDLVSRLARLTVEESMDALKGKGDMAAMIALFRAVCEAAPNISPGVYAVGVQLLARSGAPVEEIYSLIEAGAKEHPDHRNEFFAVGYDALIRTGAADFPGEQRIDDALRLAQRACETTKPPPVVLHTVWVYQVWLNPQSRDFASLARAVEIARDTNTIDPLLEELVKGLKGRDGQTPDIGDVIYEMALAVNRLGDRRPLVEWMYRTAIRHSPNHLWAHNNLGYSLLEEDREIEEAVRHIETAYATMLADPMMDGRAPIIDSMGWARYKQGLLADEVGPDGAVVREGALTLLKRSYEQASIRPEYAEAMPVIVDHYADALWVSGQREKAIELWTDAATRAASILSKPVDARRELSASMRAEIEETGASAQSKVSAAKSDTEPQVARIHRLPEAGAPKAPGGADGMIQ